MSDPEVLPHRSRKDTRRWCKGKPGREHTVEVVLHDYRAAHWRCGRRFGIPLCFHVDRCSTCGKILRHYDPKDCPDG